MKYHIITALMALALSALALGAIALTEKLESGWCDIRFNASNATMPCTALKERVYEVTL